MTAPYYQDDLVTLYHGDCREVLAGMADTSVDCVITDPPYSDRTHGQAKTNRGRGHGVKAVDFAAFTEAALTEVLTECGRVTRRWLIATVDYAHAFRLDQDPGGPPSGVRLGLPSQVGTCTASGPGREPCGEAVCVVQRGTGVGPVLAGCLQIDARCAGTGGHGTESVASEPGAVGCLRGREVVGHPPNLDSQACESQASHLLTSSR